MTVTLNPGTGGAVVAVETVSGNVVPFTKLHTGANNVDDGPVALTNPLPITNVGPLPFGADNVSWTLNGDGTVNVITYKILTVTVKTGTCTYASGVLTGIAYT